MGLNDDLSIISANAAKIHDFVNAAPGTIVTDGGGIINLAMAAYQANQKVLQLSIFNPRGPWVTATEYVFRDIVEHGGSAYMALVDHESGVFADDLAADRLAVYQDTMATSALVASLARDLEGEGVDLVARAKKVINSVADLNETQPGTHGNVYVRCFAALGDGGFGEFEWVDSSTATPVEGMVHQVTGIVNGRWHRRSPQPKTVALRQLGVTGYDVNNAEVFETIKTLAGSEDYTVLMDSNVTVGTDLTLPANITLKFVKGYLLNVNSGVTLEHYGLVDAGEHRLFTGSGNIRFSEFRQNIAPGPYPPAIAGKQSTVYAAWWGGVDTDIGQSISLAVYSLRHRGGKVLLPAYRTVLLTSANITDCVAGIIIEGQSSGGFNFPMIHAKCAGKAVFDLTGSLNVVLRDVGMKGDTILTPFCGVLLARSSTGASYGNHLIENLNTGGNFQVAPIYNYASEVVNVINPNIHNFAPNGKAVVHTANNVFNAASDYQTIATGPQSNSVFHIEGGQIYAAGGGDSDIFYLEAPSDFSVEKSFLYCGGGRSYVCVENGLTNCSFKHLRAEPSPGNEADYGFLFVDSDTVAFMNVEHANMYTGVKWLYMPNGSDLQYSTFKGNNDASATGIDIYDAKYCMLDLCTNIYTSRHMTEKSHVIGSSASVTFTNNVGSTFVDLLTGTFMSAPNLPENI